ncbi:MAG: seg [Candidatus Taylorbacteria bacterium]|nr:seg [Candidatus Taylorbacteria bacterium]
MKKQIPKIQTNKGMSIIEVLIGSAIIVTGILALIASHTAYTQYAIQNEKNTEITYLLGEGLESLYFLRDKGWTAYIAPLSTSTTYYLAFNGSYWAATTTPQYVDGTFLRKITIDDVKRDSNSDIASSGTLDANTKKVTAAISYSQGQATTTQTISTYVANIYGN